MLEEELEINVPISEITRGREDEVRVGTASWMAMAFSEH